MTTLDLAALTRQLDDGSVSSEALVRACLEAITQHQDYNAWITVADESALATARERDRQRAEGHLMGPLHGITLAIKDNIHVAGICNTAGTRALQAVVPGTDAGVVARLREVGAIIIGKNNLHELAYGITSNNYAYGAVRNAFEPAHFAGGSSGGTAAAVALGMAAAGLGTDTGGSVRIPSALNNLVGFRPTVGRYPGDGLVTISTTRDTAGPITRTVGDAVRLDAVLADVPLENEPAQLQGLRLGVPRAVFWENLDPEVARVAADTLGKLSAAGVVLVEADIPGIAGLNEAVSFPVVLHETAQTLPAYLATNAPEVSLDDLLEQIRSPDVKEVVGASLGGAIPVEAYRVAINTHRPALQQAYARYFKANAVEAVVFPTTPLPARPIEGSLETIELNGAQEPTFNTYIRNTDPASNADIPGLTIPAGRSNQGLPVGMEIDGPAGSDRRLLAIGLALEAVLAP